MKKNEENLPEVHKAELMPERDLDSEISQVLVKANVTDAVIAELKNKYGGLKLKDIDDKEGYLEICEARKQTRKIGIMAEKICKAGRADAVSIQKKWLSKEEEVLDKINEIQNPLDEEIKKFEDHEAEIEAAEKKRQEEQFMSRQTTLLKMEAKFADGAFTLGGVSYELNNIKEADEEIWNDVILNKFKKEFEKVEAARAVEEKKKQEAAAELARQQEELRKQQEQFEEQKRQMAEQQRILDEQKRQQEDAIRQEQQRKENEAKAQKQQRDSRRIQQLMNLGLYFTTQSNSYVYEDVNVDVMTEINLFDDAQWSKLIEDISPVIAERKAAAAQKEIDRIEKEKQAAVEIELQKERDRVAEQARLDEVKRQQEEQLKVEESAKASDKEKWAAYISAITAIPIPEFRSGVYRKKATVTKEKLSEISEL